MTALVRPGIAGIRQAARVLGRGLASERLACCEPRRRGAGEEVEVRTVQMMAIGAVVLVGFFDNFSQFPIVAPYARALGATPSLIGLTVAVYSLTNLLGNLGAGFMLDRLGRKRLLVAGLGWAGLAVLAYAAAQTPAQLVAVRAFHGLAAAVLAPAAFTLLGDLLPAKQRGRAMGLNGALIALAAMVAPAFSGVMRDRFGFEGVFLAVGSILLATCVVAHFLIADTYRPAPSERASAGVYLALFRRPGLSLAFLAAAALTFGLGTLVTHLPIHLSDLGHGGTQTGLAFSSFALVAMFVMAAPMALPGGAWGRLGPLGWGLLAIGTALALLPLRAEMAALAVLMALYGLGFGLVFPAANALVADCTEPRERGTAFGLFYAFYSVGVIVGAMSAGFLAGVAGGPSPFHAAAVVALPAGGVLLYARSRLALSVGAG